MHICLFDLGWGGVGVHSLNLKHNLEKRGLDVTMFTPQRIDEDSIIQLPMTGNRYLTVYEQIFRFLREFKKREKELEFDILHFNHSIISLSFISFFKRFPTLICTDITLNGLLNDIITGKLKGARFLLSNLPLTYIEKKALHSVDEIIVWSKKIKAEMIENGVRDEKIKVLYPGVDAEFFIPKKKNGNKTNIIFLGRAFPRKGGEYLLKSFESVSKKFDCELIIAGVERSSIKQPIKNPKVKILGGVPYAELPQFYHTGDIFCLPSTWETVPTSILEAMACGLPIIATDVGGITEIVKDGETGLIVPSRDCDALTNAMTTMIEDTDKRIEMGKKARTNAEKFRWEKVTDAFLSVYEKVMR